MTKQEQIKAIKQIIDERVETALGQVQGRHDNVIKTVDTVIIARDIVEAGYGDVSAYKAEIERLKAEIKQAKIDVLNELKRQGERCARTYFGCEVVSTRHIDEMIEELKK